MGKRPFEGGTGLGLYELDGTTHDAAMPRMI
jgi:hypothetical protein